MNCRECAAIQKAINKVTNKSYALTDIYKSELIFVNKSKLLSAITN